MTATIQSLRGLLLHHFQKNQLPPPKSDDDEQQEGLIDRVVYYTNNAYTVSQVLNIDGKTLVIGTDRNENEIEIGIEKIKFIDFGQFDIPIGLNWRRWLQFLFNRPIEMLTLL